MSFALLTALPPLPTPPAPTRPIGSWWRRILAFLVDLFVVGSAESILALPFHEQLIRLGNWSVLIGFCLGLPYYVLYNSAKGGGQTLGKRILSLEVVDVAGNPISVEFSFFRYIIFAIPIVLNGVALPFQTPTVLSALVEFGNLTLQVAIPYLILFNTRTRQGVHDLVAGSYVVEAGRPGRVNPKPFWKGHWIILGSLVAIVSARALWLTHNPVTANLRADLDLVQQQQDVESVSISQYLHPDPGSSAVVHNNTIQIRWSGDANDEQAFADDIAALLREHDPSINQTVGLNIIVIRGYNLGFTFGSSSHAHWYSPTGVTPDADDPPSDSTKPR